MHSRATFIGVCLSLPALTLIPQLKATNSKRIPGQWSARAVYTAYGLKVFDGPGGRRISRIPSPDGRFTVVMSKVDMKVLQKGKVMCGSKRLGAETLAEILWAPDSSAFAVTQSDGGWLGSWYMEVYRVGGKCVERVRGLSRVAEKHAAMFRCGGKRTVGNWGAVWWSDNGDRLGIVAEVPTVSDCTHLGRLTGYVISLPGADIVESLSETEVLRQWKKALGQRIRN